MDSSLTYIKAASHYTKVEHAILEALAEIPEVIDGARRYIQIYSQVRDQLLERRTFDLYRSILRALTHIMQFFADSSFRKLYPNVFFAHTLTFLLYREGLPANSQPVFLQKRSFS